MILEPVQNSGGCFVPPEGYFQRVREICDEYGVLFISDEVICSWGRLGEYFGAERFGYQPDLITTAKGLTSAYAPMGAVIASDRVFAPFADGPERPSRTGSPSAGTPCRAAVALANLDVFEDGGPPASTCARNEGAFRAMLDVAARHPDRRRRARRGLLHGDRARARPRDEGDLHRRRSATGCCATSCSADLFQRGLICRADDRGDPVIQLSPPLIAGPEEFAEIEGALRPALEEASRRLALR